MDKTFESGIWTRFGTFFHKVFSKSGYDKKKLSDSQP